MNFPSIKQRGIREVVFKRSFRRLIERKNKMDSSAKKALSQITRILENSDLDFPQKNYVITELFVQMVMEWGIDDYAVDDLFDYMYEGVVDARLKFKKAQATSSIGLEND